MSAENRLSPITYTTRHKTALFLGWLPLAAIAASTAVPDQVDQIPALSWCFVAGLCLMGWAVADLDKVAELWNPATDASTYEHWKQRLQICKGLAASSTAGVLTYFLGKAAPGMIASMMGIQAAGTGPQIPEMGLFVAVAGAAYMGTRWFDWLEKRMTRNG